MDNGFLLFNQVKVPHISMLAKHSSVDAKTGVYVRPQSAALVYGTMTWVRSTIVLQAGQTLARGVTIAMRYCAVRRQFQDRDDESNSATENQVLNYSMVQFRLLPLLAATYALHFTGKIMMDMYAQSQETMKRAFTNAKRGAGPEELQSGSDQLADLHATSCGLKALSSTIAAAGLEECRRACGGHGYSAFSGIGSWYADYLPTTTWEGDNYMLTQQVARYLLKTARAVQEGSAADNDTSAILRTFLAAQDKGCAFDVLASDADLVAAFAWRTAFLTFEALRRRDVERRSWNALLVDFWRLSTAHSQYLVVKNFYATLQSPALAAALDPAAVAAMHALFRLFALDTLEKSAAEFYASGALTVRQIQLVRSRAVLQLLDEVRPHALRLVDAWAFPDWQLDSSLGRADGRVYEDMFRRGAGNPLNGLTLDPYPDSAVLVKRDENEHRAKSRL